MDPKTEKTCSGCSETKPVAEFNFNNKKKGYRSSTCKACQSERHRQWVQSKSPEQYRDYVRRIREWERAHPEKKAAWLKKWRRENPERATAWRKAWEAENRERLLAYWRAKSRERRVRAAESKANNPVEKPVDA